MSSSFKRDYDAASGLARACSVLDCPACSKLPDTYGLLAPANDNICVTEIRERVEYSRQNYGGGLVERLFRDTLKAIAADNPDARELAIEALKVHG